MQVVQNDLANCSALLSLVLLLCGFVIGVILVNLYQLLKKDRKKLKYYNTFEYLTTLNRAIIDRNPKESHVCKIKTVKTKFGDKLINLNFYKCCLLQSLAVVIDSLF